MTTVLQARVNEQHLEKLDALKNQTGLTTSQIFRRLLERAEARHVQTTINLSENANSDVTRPGTIVAVAS